MEYIEAIKIFESIETKYDVMSIKYHNISIWPYLRIYLFDAVATHSAVERTSSALLLVLKSLFRFNPLRFFKKYWIWDYSASITRKKIGNYYEHHVSGYLHKSGYPVLTIEFPSIGSRIIARKEIPEKSVISGAWFLIIAAIIEQYYKIVPIRIEREEVLQDIMSDLGVGIDYKMRLCRLLSQKKTNDILLSLGHHPRLAVIQCYYTAMGIIWSFHNHNIPVVELQHGVINNNHYAYNSKYHSDLLYPDEICVYGVEEYSFFTRKKPPFAKMVTQTGVYLLDQADEYFDKDLFADYRKKYKKIAVVAGETGFEEIISSFIDNAAKKYPSCFFVYIPRRATDLQFESSNVKLVFDVNIYEYLKWCDIHITHASTTGLEAHYFKKPVFFYDFDGVAEGYYGRIIGESNGAFYVHTEEEFIDKLDKIDQSMYSYRELFAHNSEQRMQGMLDRYLKTGQTMRI